MRKATRPPGARLRTALGRFEMTAPTMPPREPTQNELAAWIDAAERAANQLKDAIVAEEIYVATSEPTSFIPYSHLTKAFQIHGAVLILCRAGYGSEAMALSRSLLEMYITLRWIMNQDQCRRADDFAGFVAKRKEYAARVFAKYNPISPMAAGAVKFVEKMYKQYADKYSSWTFWSNKPSNLRQLAEEKEVLISGLVPPNDDAVMFYETFYSIASDHVHVTALALDDVFPPTGAPYKATSTPALRTAFSAVVYATQWLFYLMIRVDTYRQIGLQGKIDAIHAEFAKLYHTLDP